MLQPLSWNLSPFSALIGCGPQPGDTIMARKYSKGAAKKVARAMRKRKKSTLKSGRSGRTVKSRKQAIAIGLSEARKAGSKVPKKAATKRSAKKTRKTGKAKKSRS